MTASLARSAIVHWIRYPAVTPAGSLPLAQQPEGTVGWKVGPDGPLTELGVRGPSDTWCGFALYPDLPAAQAALGRRDLPMFAGAIEHWQALLLPIAHRGECNHLDRERPGAVYEPSAEDPGGPLFVLTTAGFVMGPGLDLARVVHFRRHVDLVRASFDDVPGRIAGQVNTPWERGDDGMTMTVWRSDADMFNAAYRPGVHRTQVETHKAGAMADRTSFTRFRMLGSAGSWRGRDPLADARAAAAAAAG